MTCCPGLQLGLVDAQKMVLLLVLQRRFIDGQVSMCREDCTESFSLSSLTNAIAIHEPDISALNASYAKSHFKAIPHSDN